jgi:hypothetical protein
MLVESSSKACEMRPARRSNGRKALKVRAERARLSNDREGWIPYRRFRQMNIPGFEETWKRRSSMPGIDSPKPGKI